MKIKFTAKVVKIEEKFEKTHIRGVGPDAEFKDVSLGWFVSFQGSYESIHVGFEKPTTKFGDIATVEITFP